MMNINRFVCVAVSCALVWGLSVPASAVLISHNGTVLQQDDLEDDTLGGDPTPQPPWEVWYRGGGDPVPPVNTRFDITDAGAPGPCPGCGGTQYIDAFQANKNVDRLFTAYHFDATTAGTLHAEWWMWTEVNGNDNHDPIFGLGNSTPGANAQFGDNRRVFFTVGLSPSTATDWNYHDASGNWVPMVSNFADSTWQKYEIDVTFGTGGGGEDQFSVTLDGTTGPTINLPVGANGAPISDLFWQSIGTHNSQFYLDGKLIPEPATWVMLCGGLATLLGYAGRRRHLLRA